jgi:hypothetical protein
MPVFYTENKKFKKNRKMLCRCGSRRLWPCPCMRAGQQLAATPATVSAALRFY